MWYFSWILGVLLACAFGIINVLWLEAQEAMDQESIILDPLTRLPTRVRFLEKLENQIGEFNSEQKPFSVLFISLDAFRKLSESVEDEVLDQMVLSIAKLVKKNLRVPKDLVARYDAATFAIIIPGATANIAKTIADRICENVVSQTNIPSEDSIISIGVVEYPTHVQDHFNESTQEQVTSLLQKTDKACRQAQKQEKNSSYCAGEIVAS